MVSSYFVFLLFAVLLAGWNHVIYMYLLAAATFCRFSMKNPLTTGDMYCDLTSVMDQHGKLKSNCKWIANAVVNFPSMQLPATCTRPFNPLKRISTGKYNIKVRATPWPAKVRSAKGRFAQSPLSWYLFNRIA